MNRIKTLFKNKKDHILNIYFTAGYPNLNDTKDIILNLEKSGVDLIEVGMPYSDPVADGPTIQESGQIAIKNGMNLNLLFDQLAEVRQQSEIPLVLMGYFNQVMQYGEEAFFKKCKDAGVDGLILPDLPLEVYEADYQLLLKKYQLDISFLITPQTTESRIRKIDQLSTGFIYMVSSSSITGAKTGISQAQLDYFDRINSLKLQNPRLIGFGISNNETYETACKYAHGAIIGSAFIKALKNSTSLETTISNFVENIRQPIINNQ